MPGGRPARTHILWSTPAISSEAASGAIGSPRETLIASVKATTDQPLREAVILIAFVPLAVGIALLSMGVVWRGWSALERTMEASNRGLRLEALGGRLRLLRPFFFVYSGMTFDLEALGSAAAIAKLIMFFALFLVVRGAPAILLYRKVLSSTQRAGLVGAAMLSTLCFPFVGAALLGRGARPTPA
jgi:hypothetical protein